MEKGKKKKEIEKDNERERERERIVRDIFSQQQIFFFFFVAQKCKKYVIFSGLPFVFEIPFFWFGVLTNADNNNKSQKLNVNIV